MAGINALDDTHRGRIRSGQVIESLAHAVDELIQNALDSGATHVSVALQWSQNAVEVDDDGSGISFRDLEYVAERGYSSKSARQTSQAYGFKGEALASLVQLADLVIVSKTPDSHLPCKKSFHGGDSTELSLLPAGSRRTSGTCVRISKFFEHLPVRQQKMTKGRELENMKRLLRNYSMLHCNVEFALVDKDTGKPVLILEGAGSLLAAMQAACGNEAANGLRPIEFALGQVKVSGLFSMGWTSPEFQFMFVNRRPTATPARLRSVLAQPMFTTAYLDSLEPDSGLPQQIQVTKVDEVPFPSQNMSPTKHKPVLSPGLAADAAHQLLSRPVLKSPSPGKIVRRLQLSPSPGGFQLSDINHLGLHEPYQPEPRPGQEHKELHPVYALHIQCPPGFVDIGFDVKKNVVEFRDWDRVLNACRGAVKQYYTCVLQEATRVAASMPHAAGEASQAKYGAVRSRKQLFIPNEHDSGETCPLNVSAFDDTSAHARDTAPLAVPHFRRKFAFSSAGSITAPEQFNETVNRGALTSVTGNDGTLAGCDDRSSPFAHRAVSQPILRPEMGPSSPILAAAETDRKSPEPPAAASVVAASLSPSVDEMDALLAAHLDEIWDGQGSRPAAASAPQQVRIGDTAITVNRPTLRGPKRKRGPSKAAASLIASLKAVSAREMDQIASADVARSEGEHHHVTLHAHMLDHAEVSDYLSNKHSIDLCLCRQVLAQLDRKFILVKGEGLLLCVDQHAADERVRVEQMEVRDTMSRPSLRSFQLHDLQAAVYSEEGAEFLATHHHQPALQFFATPHEFSVIRSCGELLRTWGWSCSTMARTQLRTGRTMAPQLGEESGGGAQRTVYVHTAPQLFGHRFSIQDLRAYLEALYPVFAEPRLARVVRPPCISSVLNSKACRGALMFGDILTPDEAADLISQLRHCKLPFNCAHGRPSVVPLLDLRHVVHHDPSNVYDLSAGCPGIQQAIAGISVQQYC